MKIATNKKTVSAITVGSKLQHDITDVVDNNAYLTNCFK